VLGVSSSSEALRTLPLTVSVVHSLSTTLVVVTLLDALLEPADEAAGEASLPSLSYKYESYEYESEVIAGDIDADGSMPPTCSTISPGPPAFAAPADRYCTSYSDTLVGNCLSPSEHTATSQKGGHGVPQSNGQLSGDSGPPIGVVAQ
jgi:hypothetical protein